MTIAHYSWIIAEICHWPVNDNLEEVFKNCHWPVNDSFALQLGNRRKLALIGQWQFLCCLQNCHWPVNDNILVAFKIVTDRSMTILKQPYENAIDWSMTIFACIRNGLSHKIVIDRSVTIFKQPSKNVIDWSMTILVHIRNGLSQKIVIYWSMTIL